ncbi:unnamed protein product, partial [Oppiella nova]
MSEKSCNRCLNECHNCVHLSEVIERLKRQNLLLKDKHLICGQQLLAFNRIHGLSIECIDVLEAIIYRLDTSSVAEDCVDVSDGNDSYGSDAIADPEDGRAVESAPESPLKPESDDKPEVVSEFETIPDPGVDDGQEVVAVDGDAIPVPEASEPTVDELKQKYYNICHDLDDWVKQLDALKGIQSYPRFQCQKYADTPSPVQPSHSQPIRRPPIEYQSGGFTEERIFFKKLSSAEIQRLTNSSPKVITKSVSKSPPKERTKCRFPDCRFVTRRGQLGISEHVKEMHVNSVDTDTGSSSLHCPYPNCQYVTKSGHSLKKNLTKHIQRLHKIKSLNTVKPGFSGQQKGTTLLNKKKTLSCTYSGCHFSTIYGTHNLNRHVMSVHCKQHPITTGSVTPLKADIKVNNIGKSTKSGGKTTGAPLRCTKCSFMTRHGFAKLRNHMIIHNRELAFKCTQCDASFASNKPLFKHKRSVHKSTAPVRAAKRDYKNECDVCHQLFKWPSDMRRHRRKHEINDESKVETPNSRDAEDGQSVWYHECSHENCHFKTDRLGVLQKHVISHIVKKERDINTDEPIDTNTAIKSELSCNRCLNECHNCVHLSEVIERLKRQNLLLKDKHLICGQQLLAFNRIHGLSIECIDVLEAIIYRLDTSSVAEDCVDVSDGNDSYGSDAIADPEDGRAVESAPESPLKPESDDKPEVVSEFETIPDPGVDDGQEVVAVDGDAIPVPEASEPTVDELKQ